MTEPETHETDTSQETDGGPTVVETIDTVEELLVHAFALEMNAIARFEEVADAMDVHNNPEVAALLRDLAARVQARANAIAERAQGRELPHIAPWDFKWRKGGAASDEAPAMDHLHYLMTPYHALRLAHLTEMRAHDFHVEVEHATTSAEVRTLAAELADEAASRVMVIEDWIARYPKPDRDWDFDPDPPGVRA